MHTHTHTHSHTHSHTHTHTLTHTFTHTLTHTLTHTHTHTHSHSHTHTHTHIHSQSHTHTHTHTHTHKVCAITSKRSPTSRCNQRILPSFFISTVVCDYHSHRLRCGLCLIITGVCFAAVTRHAYTSFRKANFLSSFKS